ncbi:MAG: hypothetical protein ACREOI_30300 [bacterium]
MSENHTKICEICHVAFTPDQRVGERQRVCQERHCQQERKRRAQKNWLAKNPDAFRGRYPKLQQWLAKHPDYLKNYRARQKQLAPPGRGDIQDELTGCQNSSLMQLRQLVDVQDEITAKITACKQSLQALICKMSQLLKTLEVNGA